MSNGRFKSVCSCYSSYYSCFETSWRCKKEQFAEPNADFVYKGLPNLAKHVENMKMFGVNPIVTINKFDTVLKKLR